jgi:hypothetical protein
MRTQDDVRPLSPTTSLKSAWSSRSLDKPSIRRKSTTSGVNSVPTQFKRPTTRNDRNHARMMYLGDNKTGFPHVTNYYASTSHLLEAICDSLDSLSKNAWVSKYYQESNPLRSSTSNNVTNSNSKSVKGDELFVNTTSYNRNYQEWPDALQNTRSTKMKEKKRKKDEKKRVGYEFAPYGIFGEEELKSTYEKSFDLENNIQKDLIPDNIFSEKYQQRVKKSSILNNPWQENEDTDTSTTTTQEDSDESGTVTTNEENEDTNTLKLEYDLEPSEADEQAQEYLLENEQVEDKESDDEYDEPFVLPEAQRAREIINSHRPKSTRSSGRGSIRGDVDDDRMSIISSRRSVRSSMSNKSGRSTSSATKTLPTKVGYPVYMPRVQPLFVETEQPLATKSPIPVLTPVRSSVIIDHRGHLVNKINMVPTMEEIRPGTGRSVDTISIPASPTSSPPLTPIYVPDQSLIKGLRTPSRIASPPQSIIHRQSRALNSSGSRIFRNSVTNNSIQRKSVASGETKSS